MTRLALCDLNVRFGSKADICSAADDVRFTPNSHRKSGLPQKNMSALHPKADMCGATSDVRYGPIADIEPCKKGTAARRLSEIRFCASGSLPLPAPPSSLV